MPALRVVASSAGLAVVFGIGLAAGCYSERATPPTYRYPCSSSDQCPEDESCIDGLCQIPCTTATFEDDCPQNGSYLACFNGVCAGGCDVAQTRCPGDLECIDLGLDVSGGGFIGGGSDATIGVCGRMCEPGTTSCPDGEVCLQGFCVVTCDPDAVEDLCPSGFACTLGVCIPPGFGPETASGSDAGIDSSGGTADGGTADGGTADGGTLEGGTTLMDPDAPVTSGEDTMGLADGGGDR